MFGGSYFIKKAIEKMALGLGANKKTARNIALVIFAGLSVSTLDLVSIKAQIIEMLSDSDNL